MVKIQDKLGRNLENLQYPLYIGNGVDKVIIDTDGNLTLEGEATVFEDIQSPLIGERLFSNAGTIDYNYDNLSVTMQPGGSIADRKDTITKSVQYPHKAKADGKFYLHIHWEQTSSADYTFTVEYRVQSQLSEKVVPWTQVVVSSLANNTAPYPGSGTFNQITPLVDIDMTGAGLSAVVQIKIARTDNEPGNIEATFIDLHYEIDSIGSNAQYVK